MKQNANTTSASTSIQQIRFAIGECSLGFILVAISELGICAIAFGDGPNVLASEVRDRFPEAERIIDDAEFNEILTKVVDFIEARGSELDLPLDICGTTFQLLVWEMLQKIPVGSTTSYTDIARYIGSPKAVRAVASACAANTLAVAIPCHRVVRTDGSLAGYRWGVERKAELLRRESEVEKLR